MVSASSDSNFKGFIFDDLQNIKANNNDLFLDASDIGIYESLLDEDFDNKSDTNKSGENDIINIMATWLKITTTTTIPDLTKKTFAQHSLPPDVQPLDYLFLFLLKSFIEAVAKETNKYAYARCIIYS